MTVERREGAREVLLYYFPERGELPPHPHVLVPLPHQVQVDGAGLHPS